MTLTSISREIFSPSRLSLSINTRRLFFTYIFILDCLTFSIMMQFIALFVCLLSSIDWVSSFDFIDRKMIFSSVQTHGAILRTTMRNNYPQIAVLGCGSNKANLYFDMQRQVWVEHLVSSCVEDEKSILQFCQQVKRFH